MRKEKKKKRNNSTKFNNSTPQLIHEWESILSFRPEIAQSNPLYTAHLTPCVIMTSHDMIHQKFPVWENERVNETSHID